MEDGVASCKISCIKFNGLTKLLNLVEKNSNCSVPQEGTLVPLNTNDSAREESTVKDGMGISATTQLLFRNH